ncbi:MAG: hypothetical protein PHV93_01905 [Candidatus Pacebacteria bacterium]|nr:hypothetical protein [Candidatus Paceibacterota bacterium]
MSEKILKIIEEGGDELLHDTAGLLTSIGWACQISSYYMDVLTGKSREIDIIARKEFIVKDDFWGGSKTILIRLFIECKYIKNETLFYFVTKNSEKAKTLAKDNSILKHDDYVDLRANHYLKGLDVAKTWKGATRDDIYDALTQSVHSLIYYEKNYREKTHYIYNLPVVVTKSFDNFFKKEGDDRKFSEIRNNFQLEFDYTYTLAPKENVSKTFLVDFVSYDKIEAFLKDIENGDLSILKSKLAQIIFEEGRMQHSRRDDVDPFSNFR